MRLDPRAMAAVIDVCGLRYTTEGEVLIEQGQPGNFFFVVKEGTFALKVTPTPDLGEQSSRNRYSIGMAIVLASFRSLAQQHEVAMTVIAG